MRNTVAILNAKSRSIISTEILVGINSKWLPLFHLWYCHSSRDTNSVMLVNATCDIFTPGVATSSRSFPTSGAMAAGTNYWHHIKKKTVTLLMEHYEYCSIIWNRWREIQVWRWTQHVPPNTCQSQKTSPSLSLWIPQNSQRYNPVPKRCLTLCQKICFWRSESPSHNIKLPIVHPSRANHGSFVPKNNRG